MEIEKTFIVNADKETVWQFITSPQLAGQCIPGCQEVQYSPVFSVLSNTEFALYLFFIVGHRVDPPKGISTTRTVLKDMA